MRFQLLDAGPFLSSGMTVLLGAIAAATRRVRIQTGVCVLSIPLFLPVRPASDGQECPI